MTMTDRPTTEIAAAITFDLYRDIHKGIRAELFSVTAHAGRLDPGDRAGRVELAARVRALVDLLVAHSEHEDGAIQPVLEARLPSLAEQISADHEMVEARLGSLQELADEALDASEADGRGRLHRLYLELSSFTSAYLAHQDLEERLVMPALEQAIGVDEVMRVHTAILASIPPHEMAESLAVMLPAMNLDDRAELLGGMRADAPAEVFAGVWGLAESVLGPSEQRSLAARLGLS